ncbi:MAG: hypothetical protein V4577_04530 [Bacteroidota bacterium]
MDFRRILLLLVCAGLLVWLCLSKKTAGRAEQLNAALKKGQVGRLPLKDSLQLDSLLAKIVKGAGISTPYTLNRAFDGGKELRFFTCQPSAVAVTNCSKGNAVFDAELNAVFLDQSLVVPQEWRLYDPYSGFEIKPEELPFLRTYLEFIILHELGHFKLHHASAGFLDAGKSAHSLKWRKYEAQADSFAVRNMSLLIASDSSHTFFAPGTDGTIELKVDATTPARSKTMTGLADVGQNMTFGMLFGLSPYSAFYQDEAHPTFIDRAKGFLNGALKENKDRNSYTQRGEYTRNFLDRIEEVGKNNALVEVSLAKPVLNLNFDTKGIFIQTTDSGAFHAAYRPLSPEAQGSLKKVVARPLVVKPANRFRFEVDRLLSFGDKGTYSVAHDKTLKRYAEGQGWVPAVFPKFDFTNWRLPSVAPQPAGPAVFLDGYAWAYRVQEGRVDSVRKSDLLKSACSAIGRTDLDLDWSDALAGGDAVYLMVTDAGGKRLVGVAALDLQTMRLRSAKALNLADKRLNLAAQALDTHRSRLLVDETNGEVYLVTAQLSPELEGQFGLFRLSAGAAPQLVWLKQFLYAKNTYRDQLNIKPGLWNGSIGRISAQSYAVNWDSDAVYAVDLGKQTAEPVFMPGSETLQMRVGTNGMLAFFSAGCYKFYVLQPGHRAGSWCPWWAAGALLFMILVFTIIKLKK